MKITASRVSFWDYLFLVLLHLKLSDQLHCGWGFIFAPMIVELFTRLAASVMKR